MFIISACDPEPMRGFERAFTTACIFAYYLLTLCGGDKLPTFIVFIVISLVDFPIA